MTIALSTNPGGIFTRWGKIFAALRTVNGSIGDTEPASATQWGSGGPNIHCAKTAFDNIEAQYQSTLQQLMDGLYTTRDSLRSAVSGTKSTLNTLAQNTLIQQANADTPLPSLSLTPALQLLINQMVAASASIQKNTVSASITALRANGAANVGTGTLVVAMKEKTGVDLEYSNAETIRFTCTADRSAGASSGSESFTFAGGVAVSDALAYNAPLGSGCGGSLTVVDCTLNAGNNLLTNSDFETFVTTANVPDSWVVTVGAAGTQVLAGGSSAAYRGSNCLEFAGDGSTLAALTQAFGQTTAATGTTATLQAATVYLFNCYVKVSAVPATGVLQISLVDGSGTVINDDAGNAQSVTLDLTAQTTSYASFSGALRTPTNMPTTVKLRVRQSTALENAKNAFIDSLALTKGTQLYRAGPYAAIFRGATDFVLTDQCRAVVANDYGGKFQTQLWLAFNLPNLNLQIPSSGSPTVADSLLG